MTGNGLVFQPIRELLREVDEAGPPPWLFRAVWPGDAYGVLAAEDKAGKSWAACDAAVSVASGTPWLRAFECDSPGPVLLFAGEGGARNLARRLRAVASARGLDAGSLPITVCLRVPHLTDGVHLALIREQLAERRNRLVILDPLYLAARGANGADLYAMGAALEGLQHVAQEAGAALLVVTHFNKNGDGKGARRITGVGPGAWGRVLATAHVESRRTDEDGASTVILGWQFVGGEIPDTDLRTRRCVRADDPTALDSRLSYEVSVLDDGGAAPAAVTGLAPSAQRVREVLLAATEPLTVQQIGDQLASRGRPLRKRTIQEAALALAGEVDSVVLDGRGTKAFLLAAKPTT